VARVHRNSRPALIASDDHPKPVPIQGHEVGEVVHVSRIVCWVG